MRVNLITETSDRPPSSKGNVPLSLTIRPAGGLPGEYRYPTDSESLMRLLRKETSLRAAVLARFEDKLSNPIGARLLDVDLSESVLTRIGYFID